MPIQRITPEADERVKRRALLAVFITIFVSLIGFGIVITNQQTKKHKLTRKKRS